MVECGVVADVDNLSGCGISMQLLAPSTIVLVACCPTLGTEALITCGGEFIP